MLFSQSPSDNSEDDLPLNAYFKKKIRGTSTSSVNPPSIDSTASIPSKRIKLSSEEDSARPLLPPSSNSIEEEATHETYKATQPDENAQATSKPFLNKPKASAASGIDSSISGVYTPNRPQNPLKEVKAPEKAEISAHEQTSTSRGSTENDSKAPGRELPNEGIHGEVIGKFQKDSLDNGDFHGLVNSVDSKTGGGGGASKLPLSSSHKRLSSANEGVVEGAKPLKRERPDITNIASTRGEDEDSYWDKLGKKERGSSELPGRILSVNLGSKLPGENAKKEPHSPIQGGGSSVKAKSVVAASPSSKEKQESPITSKKGPIAKPRKLLKKTEIDFEPINRWWTKGEEELDTNQMWTYLEHNGILFTPSYEPHGIKMKLEGVSISLPPEAEEVANFWCGILDSDYAGKTRFINNFWKAFMEKLPPDHPIRVKNRFESCDFLPIKEHLDSEKERKKNLTKEEKEEIKRQKLEAEAPYSYALVDWLREKLGNSKVEPPGLFRGRGDHPKQGQLKSRIFPENVTLNCAEDAPVPMVADGDQMLPGHCWNDVYHDNTVTWLAFYKDSINDQFKYMYLAAQSKFKGLQDFLKYEKARKLKHYVEKVRKDYTEKMRSSNMTEKQLGTATYLIDFLALRVGGEKDTDEEADTVGCCSLRPEHIAFNSETEEITLDFLGKDSIRYFNTVKISEQAFENLRLFCKGKKADENLFERINCASLNAYLKEMMTGLTAKVFRTYNASITLQQQLEKIHTANIDKTNCNELLQFYNDANREVAILCNHQRSVPKQHEASMEKMQKQLNLLDEDIKEYQEYLLHLKKGKTSKFKVKSEVLDLDGNPRKPVTKEGMKEVACRSKLSQALKKRQNHMLKMRIKDDNKTVALGTSKINYMDPRITVAFCKSYEINIERCFNKSLRLKFPWAMFSRMDFKF